MRGVARAAVEPRPGGGAPAGLRLSPGTPAGLGTTSISVPPDARVTCVPGRELGPRAGSSACSRRSSRAVPSLGAVGHTLRSPCAEHSVVGFRLVAASCSRDRCPVPGLFHPRGEPRAPAPAPTPASGLRAGPSTSCLGWGWGGVGPDGSPGPDTASPVGAASPGAFPSGAGLCGQRARAVLPGASPSSCCRLSPVSAAFSGASQEHCRVGGSVLRTCGAAR